MACPVCERGELAQFAAADDLPVFCNVLWPTREEALAAPRGDIRLGFCAACGFVRNLAFDPELVRYNPAYENSLHFSPSFERFARGLADRLIDRYDLHGKDIVDVGCGKGEFLTLLCAETGNRGWGFDPSYGGQLESTLDGRITIVRDYYSEAYADTPADLISCRHVIEHLDAPAELLETFGKAAGDRDPTLYFEMPDGGYMLREIAIWDVIYEHASYFTAPALRRLFERFGYRLLDLGSSFGGQYLFLEANRRGDGDVPTGDSPETLSALVAEFERRCVQKVADWNERVGEWLDAGQRIAVWGAGSKGVTFLNMIERGGEVALAIDINTRKHGRFVPGTGQQVAAPEAARAANIDVVLVMNQLYVDEIRRSLEASGSHADVVVV